MADSAWSIRFFHANNYKDDGTIDFVSNFKKGKDRQLDTIRTYSGMYGIDNYLIWEIHKDLPNYDFSTVALNLNLCLYKNPEIVYFQDFYRVKDIRYNPNKSKYTLYAISETTVKLHKKLISFGVTSLSYKENRTASDIIREVIEDNDIFYVVYHEDKEATKSMIDYEYRYFDIDVEWTVLDFIEYICNNNMYEWCVDKRINEDNVPTEILHFGHEIKAMKDRNATKDFELEKDNISQTVFTMKITTDGSPMEPLAHWEERLRCIWSKHAAGKTGGISKGCFVPIGGGHFDKFLYLKSLDGNIEKHIGYSRLSRTSRNVPSVKIGNILADEGDPQFIDIISVQKNPDLYPIREPHNILIDRGDDIAVQHQLERATRSTPYLDHEAGLLFPSPKLDNPPPNSMIFNIEGKSESSVVGGYVYGNGREELNIPIKERDDFRLKFPDKSEFYYNSTEGIWHLESPKGFVFKNSVNTEWDDIPTKSRLAVDNTVMHLQDDAFWIEGPIHLFQLEAGGCFHIIPVADDQGNPGEGRYQIHAYNDLGRIDLYADNEINIKISEVDGEIDISIGPDGTYAGTVNINCGGTINIGANATAVNIAGGANKLSHADHIHPINCKPGPPTSTGTHPQPQGTIITKAD